jgi:hypothetical protein
MEALKRCSLSAIRLAQKSLVPQQINRNAPLLLNASNKLMTYEDNYFKCRLIIRNFFVILRKICSCTSR